MLDHYIFLSKYARSLPEDGRRETWEESTQRYISFFSNKLSPEDAAELLEAIRNREVMPSMRALMTAGPALERDHAAGYNCAAMAITSMRCFDELFYLLMCGTGVGISVERQYISKLPPVADSMYESSTVIRVRDSKIGWAKALKELIALLVNGDIPKWDLSQIRPAGSPLKTFGGRASGPEPLGKLFDYTVRLFKKATGRRLNSLEAHDLCCKIADTVIVGSVRRSAMISLSNLTDQRMATAKTGEWYLKNPERALANNSVAYTEKPEFSSYLREAMSLYDSKAGERGIINKVALKKKAQGSGREYEGDYLLNPCGEAILRDSGGFCNLTEVVIRPEDSGDDLKRKVRLATILGTLQSTLTDFRYLRKIWKDNAEEERLLGVSFTGIMDHEFMGIPSEELKEFLRELKQVSLETNREYAEKLKISPSKQLTLVKPSGTVSLLCNTSSGIHPRFAKTYLRRVTQDEKDPLTDFMISQGIPYVRRDSKVIFSFPVAAPIGSRCIRDVSPMEQLELWLIYREQWCDGNPSCTIYYTDDTFLQVQQWVWDHWDSIGGLSFFPYDDCVYDREIQPYLEISEDEYIEVATKFPCIQWELFKDTGVTERATEYACAGGACEL